jgi:hypothetical protein
MRLSLALAVSLIAGCAATASVQDHVAPAQLVGVLGSEEHADPSGGLLEGAVITLEEPRLFGGRAYNSVQLILNEHYLVRWQELAGRRALVSCAVGRGTLWAHDHLMCAPESIKVEP